MKSIADQQCLRANIRMREASNAPNAVSKPRNISGMVGPQGSAKMEATGAVDEHGMRLSAPCQGPQRAVFARWGGCSPGRLLLAEAVDDAEGKTTAGLNG